MVQDQLALAVFVENIESAMKRQCSRINWLRAGDASTTFFHAKVNTRKRENFILSLNKDGVAATSHSEKEEVIKDHFTKLQGTQQRRTCTINWDEI